jgi:hypothetical protein
VSFSTASATAARLASFCDLAVDMGKLGADLLDLGGLGALRRRERGVRVGEAGDGSAEARDGEARRDQLLGDAVALGGVDGGVEFHQHVARLHAVTAPDKANSRP